MDNKVFDIIDARYNRKITRDLKEIVIDDKDIFEHVSEEDHCRHFVGTIMKHQEIHWKPEPVQAFQ